MCLERISPRFSDIPGVRKHNVDRRNPAKSAAWFELGGMLPVAASTQIWALRFKTADHRKRAGCWRGSKYMCCHKKL